MDKRKIPALILIFSFGIFMLFHTPSANAFRMANLLYILNMANLNSIAGESAGSGFKLNQTSGETGNGLYTGSGYTLRAGFQYIKSIIPFSFRIENTTINFGTLDPSTPIERSSTLTVSNNAANGYIVTANENHSLLVPSSGSFIPDTTCDNGLCTPTTSDAWVIHSSNSTTYGFGYRCNQMSPFSVCASGFTDPTYFKQFAASPSAVTVMSGTSGRNQKTQIIYRVNVSPTQTSGLYSNIVMYIATPTF